MTIKNGIGNAYSIKKTAGTNIVGGPYKGGNYWAKPDGTGFSQTQYFTNWIRKSSIPITISNI